MAASAGTIVPADNSDQALLVQDDDDQLAYQPFDAWERFVDGRVGAPHNYIEGSVTHLTRLVVGATVSIRFKAESVALIATLGDQGPTVILQVDNGPHTAVSLRHKGEVGQQRILLASELDAKVEHVATVTVSDQSPNDTLWFDVDGFELASKASPAVILPFDSRPPQPLPTSTAPQWLAVLESRPTNANNYEDGETNPTKSFEKTTLTSTAIVTSTSVASVRTSSMAVPDTTSAAAPLVPIVRNTSTSSSAGTAAAADAAGPHSSSLSKNLSIVLGVLGAYGLLVAVLSIWCYKRRKARRQQESLAAPSRTSYGWTDKSSWITGSSKTPDV